MVHFKSHLYRRGHHRAQCCPRFSQHLHLWIGHSGLTGGCFWKILEIELAIFLESLDPYWSGKNEKRLSEGHFVCFSRVSKWQFFNFQCKYDTLHIFNKTMQDRKFWRVTLKFLVNLDPFTNSCVAVFCENAYFWRNEAKKMAKKFKKWPICAFLMLLLQNYIPSNNMDSTQWKHIAPIYWCNSE